MAITLQTIRKFPKRTSAGVAVGVFGIFMLLFPHTMSEHWQNVTINIIEVIGATGVVDYCWRNKKQAWAWVKDRFHKKS
jgi:hypothetical protein